MFYCDLYGVDFSLLVNLSMILYLRCVVCFTWFVNCLLKCSAFCLSVIAVLFSKVMVMLGVCFFVLGHLGFSRVCENSFSGLSCF